MKMGVPYSQPTAVIIRMAASKKITVNGMSSIIAPHADSDSPVKRLSNRFRYNGTRSRSQRAGVSQSVHTTPMLKRRFGQLKNAKEGNPRARWSRQTDSMRLGRI